MKDYYDHIADYINGRLSPEDNTVFKNAMNKDKDLRDAVENYDLLSVIGEAALEEEVVNTIEKQLAKPKAVKSKLKVLWIVFIVIIILSLTIYYAVFQSDDYDVKELQFAELYEEPAWPQVRGSSKDELELLFKDFDRQKPNSTIAKLRQEESPLAKYWLAEIFLSIGEPDSALLYLPQRYDDNLYRDRIKYLEILAFIKKEDYQNAQITIDNLPVDLDEYYLRKLGLN